MWKHVAIVAILAFATVTAAQDSVSPKKLDRSKTSSSIRKTRQLRGGQAVEIARYHAIRELAGLAIDAELKDIDNPKFLEISEKTKKIEMDYFRSHFDIKTPAPVTDTEKARARMIRHELGEFQKFEREKLAEAYGDSQKYFTAEALTNLTDYYKKRYGDEATQKKMLDAQFKMFLKRAPYPVIDPATVENLMLSHAPFKQKPALYAMPKKPVKLAYEIMIMHAMEDRVKNDWLETVPFEDYDRKSYETLHAKIGDSVMMECFGVMITEQPKNDTEKVLFERAAKIGSKFDIATPTYILDRYDYDKDGLLDAVEMEGFTRDYAAFPEHPERYRAYLIDIFNRAKAASEKE